jgi:FlaA1/EpsC-like NDP-sugar epimerase
MYKRLIMLVVDSLLLVAVLLASFSIRLGYWYFPEGELVWVIFGAPILAAGIFLRFELYQTIIRYIGFKALWKIVQAVSLYALVWGIIGFMTAINGIPRSVILINWLLSLLVIAGVRIMAHWILTGNNHILKKNTHTQGGRKIALVYGAGDAGIQLVSALDYSFEYKVIGFIDDSKDLQGNQIKGVKVYAADGIDSLIDQFSVDEVLIAMPSVVRSRRLAIVNELEPCSVVVRMLPGVVALAEGKVGTSDLQRVSVKDLLGRESIEPNQSLLEVNIKDKVVMITGAGGSIGSELCRQVLSLGASKLVLFEQSELALYTIDKELDNDTKVLPILGSVVDQDRVEKVCKKFSVQTVYHAAAYKHVPMVEFNNTEGVTNNVFGTLNCAQAAINSKVEVFVLISTDKAVRPTSTMGATKRSAEMILQALSKIQSTTKFSMVRFGNVLDSSGSVIPLFKKQIKNGGPVTVTDKDIVRYFMTIPEAVALVIQAGAMGDDGDVFVLDMGNPIKIYDLAVKMIHLSGLELKNSTHPDGDISITITGLRPGEKLYEELLIGDNVLKTSHPMIMKAQEDMLTWTELRRLLDCIETAIIECNQDRLRLLLIKIVPGFRPQCEVSDLLKYHDE